MKNDEMTNQGNEELFSFKKLLLMSLSQWKWILLSLILFVALGVLYIALKQPVYSRSMELLVKDTEQGGGMGDITNSFSQLGFMSSNTKVYNELISFMSPAVMMEVVERLDLTMNYNLRKGLHPTTLYGTNNPIKVEFLDLGKQDGAGFRLTLQPDGSYEISKIWRSFPKEKVKYKEVIKGNLSLDSVNTPVGFISIKKNADFFPTPEFEGTNVIDVYRKGFQLTVEGYLKKLNADLTDPDADVITLSIDDVSVQRADDLLETVVQVNNERWLEDKNLLGIATSKFITERLALIESELANVDESIAQYKSDLKVPDFLEMAKGYMEYDFKMTDDAIMITNMIAMSTFLKEYVENPANNFNVIPNATGTENQVLEEQIGRYNQKLLERNNLVANSSASNPLVKDYDKELAGMRAAIKQSINGNIVNLQNSLKNLSKAQAKNKSEMASSPKQASILLSTERQQQVIQELYLFLLQKREETELSQTFAANNIRIITPPYGPYKPVAPNKKLIIIIMAFLGVAVPVFILYMIESSNTKIRSKKDLENSPVPFAGELPFVGKKKGLGKYLKSKKKRLKDSDKPLIVVNEGKRDVPNEAFRVVRSNVEFMLNKSATSTVIALTSFNPGSGKSFVAYNLGRSFALKHKRVLVIDCDLRHGSLSSYVNSPRKGLTTYLTGETDDWQSLVVPDSEMPGMWIMPIGHKPPNPAELLENGRINGLLIQARDSYDVILLDCPPINIVVDTQIINQYVDRTLFVVRAGVLERSALAEIAALYEQQKLKNMSMLLNGTLTQFSSYHAYGTYEAVEKLR